MKRVAAALLLLACLPCSRDARAEGGKGSVELWVHQGFGTQSLKDWNDQFDLVQPAIDFGLFTGEIHNFGRAIPYGAELSYRVTRGISVGLSVGRQRAVVDNRFNDLVGFIIPDVPSAFHERDEMTLMKTTAVVGFDIPGTGLTVWGELGMGFAEAESFTTIQPESGPSPFVTEGRWDGSKAVGGLSVGFRRELGGRSLIRARVGYQMADMGELDGPAGPPRNFQGEIMKTDLSGMHVSGAVGIIFWGVR